MPIEPDEQHFAEVAALAGVWMGGSCGT